MRLGVVIIVVASSGVCWAAADLDPEDDPKLARHAEFEPWAVASADDPKLERGEPLRSRSRWQDHAVSHVKLSYRRMEVHPIETLPMIFHVAELDYYPFSSIVRLGMGLEIGLTYQNPLGAWYFVAGPALGLQYPWRVTPFVEGRFVAGFLGGSFMGQVAVSYLYVGGVDAGLEWFAAGSFHLTASVGWAHPVYKFIDLQFTRDNPLLAPRLIELASDTVTFKIGFGL